MPTTHILWISDARRLADHDALDESLRGVSSGDSWVALACIPPLDGSAYQAWLAQSLQALAADMRGLGGELLVVTLEPAQAIVKIAQALGHTPVVHTQHTSHMHAAALQAATGKILKQMGVSLLVHGHDAWVAPEDIRDATDKPQISFSSYWRQVRPNIQAVPVVPIPTSLPALPHALSCLQTPPGAWGLEPTIPWDSGFWPWGAPGEQAAQAALTSFAQGALLGYEQARELPHRAGSSRLSAHLAHGEISPDAVVRAVLGQTPGPDRDKFLSELGWRAYARYMGARCPDLERAELFPNGVPMDPATPQSWARFKRGRTGIPMVDAGLRELWATGWMHNRVRMLVADHWCKHLGHSWQEGAQWFAHTLVDFDPASNALNWQMAGGVGARNAAYFRISNPILQGKKFDPTGAYRRAWVAELSGVAAPLLDEPWAGTVAGYPAPIHTPASGRARALMAWANRQR